MLKLKNVFKSYNIEKDEVMVLKNLNLEIKQGEFVSIVGPSGCGKTTLLNLLAGIDKVSSGCIENEEEKISAFNDKQWSEWRKKKVGYIFQNFNLIDFMTAGENVELSLQLNGMTKKERKKRAKKLLAKVGLQNKVNYRPNQLSGGQKQRVAIARALANDPAILLADEPTGALDSESAAQIIDLLKKINRQQGVTVIMVTHDEGLAETADRKITMFDGRITEDEVLNEKEVKLLSGTGEGAGKMPGMSSVKVAGKNLFTKKRRTILTVLGTAIGIAGVLTVLGIGSGAKARILEEIGSVANEQVVDVREDEAVFDEDTKKKILEDENVLNIYPNSAPDVMCQYGDVVSSGMVHVIGPVNEPAEYWKENLEYGFMPSADDANEIIITRTMAENFVGEGGDIKSLIGEEVILVAMADKEDGLPTQVKETFVICGIAGKAFLGVSEIVNIPYMTSERLVKASLENEDYKPESYCVTVKDKSSAKAVKEKLNDMGFKASIDTETLGTIGIMLDLVTGVIMLVAGVALVVSGIMIALVTYIGVVERTREIGILRAIGFSRKQVQTIFVTEGTFVGIFSGCVGVILSLGFGNIVNKVVVAAFPEVAFTLYQVSSGQILFCIAFSVLLGLLCSLSPAKRASRLEPVKALGYVQ